MKTNNDNHFLIMLYKEKKLKNNTQRESLKNKNTFLKTIKRNLNKNLRKPYKNKNKNFPLKKANLINLIYKKQLLKKTSKFNKIYLRKAQIRIKKELLKTFHYKKRFRKGLRMKKLQNFRFDKFEKKVYEIKKNHTQLYQKKIFFKKKIQLLKD